MHLFQVRRQLPSLTNLQNHVFHGFLPSCAHYDVTYGASLSARPKRQTIIESEMREGFRLFALEQGRSLHWTRLPPRSATTLRLIFLTSARLISDYLTRNLHELIPTLPYSVRTRPCTSLHVLHVREWFPSPYLVVRRPDDAFLGKAKALRQPP